VAAHRTLAVCCDQAPQQARLARQAATHTLHKLRSQAARSRQPLLCDLLLPLLLGLPLPAGIYSLLRARLLNDTATCQLQKITRLAASQHSCSRLCLQQLLRAVPAVAPVTAVSAGLQALLLPVLLLLLLLLLLAIIWCCLPICQALCNQGSATLARPVKQGQAPAAVDG
jgi:hypothetical protein